MWQFPRWTPEQFAATQEALARWVAAAESPPIAEHLQCCDYGAPGCVGRAGESGWCGPCEAKLFPPRPFITETT
jgi:hypothetical protein